MDKNDELIMKKRKFEEEIVELINNSELPACVIRPILVELCNQVLIQEQDQYKNAVQRKIEKEEKQKNTEKTKK